MMDDDDPDPPVASGLPEAFSPRPKRHCAHSPAGLPAGIAAPHSLHWSLELMLFRTNGTARKSYIFHDRLAVFLLHVSFTTFLAAFESNNDVHRPLQKQSAED